MSKRIRAQLKPGDYVIGFDEAVQIHDVDLNAVDVRLPDGRRLTEELAEQLAIESVAEVRARNLIPGRKSLTGTQGEESPRIEFRAPPELKAKAAERAEQEGTTVSKLAREALERYLAS